MHLRKGELNAPAVHL
jgi:pilus assembly protein Flp/PilA